ncbi:MAG TPA: hypothetical protein VIX19_17095, partial [Terriglobales bacterium]
MSRTVAVFTAVVLAVVSLICVASCADLSASVPPCHQHHAKTCAPLLLTAESPSHVLAHAVPAMPVITVAPGLLETSFPAPTAAAVPLVE